MDPGRKPDRNRLLVKILMPSQTGIFLLKSWISSNGLSHTYRDQVILKSNPGRKNSSIFQIEVLVAIYFYRIFVDFYISRLWISVHNSRKMVTDLAVHEPLIQIRCALVGTGPPCFSDEDQLNDPH